VEWEALPAFSFNNEARVAGILSDTAGGFHVVISGNELFAFDPRLEEWSELCGLTACIAKSVAIRDSVIFTGNTAGPGSGGAVSHDRGETWAADPFSTGIASLLWGGNPGTDGALFVGGYEIWRSDEQGRPFTFDRLGRPGGDAIALVEVPPSDALPAGRMLAGLWNGITYSDDGALTFRPSNVYRSGGYIVPSIAVHPDPEHPYGAEVYAAVTLAGVEGYPVALFRSDDAGATWEETARVSAGDFGIADPNYGQVITTPDGAVWLGIEDIIGGLVKDRGTILRSTDGGRTLVEEAASFGRFAVEDFVVAPDGRLYAATDSLVWRTKDRAFPVASGGGPTDRPEVGLRVAPNPSGAAVAVIVEPSVPAAQAVVTVVDARGREVRRLHEGPLAAGERRFVVSGLAPGSYVALVRSGDGAVERSPFVVTR
jgi:photosystem II stability/assembly factor-like uncharacterized protein